MERVITPKNISRFLDTEFEKWFTMPLEGFPKDIQKLLRETAHTSFKGGASAMLEQVNKESAKNL